MWLLARPSGSSNRNPIQAGRSGLPAPHERIIQREVYRVGRPPELWKIPTLAALVTTRPFSESDASKKRPALDMLPSSCFASSRAGRPETSSSPPAPSNPAIGGAGAGGTLLRRGLRACGRRPGSRSTSRAGSTPRHGRTGRTALGGTGRTPSGAVGIGAASGGPCRYRSEKEAERDDELSDHHA